MRTVASFTVPEDAHLFRTFLESRGIEGFVFDENMVQFFWLYSQAIGGVRVAVAEEDVEDARRIHEEYMTSLRAGPYPVAPVRAWPLVVLISIAAGIPLVLFGRRGSGPT